MKPEDRERLKEAFNTAIAAMGADADEPTEGLQKRDGSPLTRRELLEATRDADEFYALVDDITARGKKTFAEIVQDVENIGRPPRPRAPAP
jgi:hypothetical protein